MKTLVLFILMTNLSFASGSMPDKFGHPYATTELIKYETSFGKGLVNCDVTHYGREYTCIIIKPCAPKGDNPCGCGEDICQ